MEKAAAAGACAGSRREFALGPWAVVALACCAASAARGETSVTQVPPAATPPVLVAQARTEPPLRMQIDASSLPRLDPQDAGFLAPRIDLSLFPSRRRSEFGPVIGLSNFTARQPPLLGLAPQRPALDLGMHWSYRLSGRQRLDVMAWRRMVQDEDAYTLVQMQQPVYGARVELDLTPVRKSGFGFGHGFIGLQLESGARITLKRTNGHPMLYYRTTF